MVRMFLASSTRGVHTVLTLETRDQQIVTTRSKRSILRREQFLKKKDDEKQQKQQETGVKIADGDSRSICSKLVV